MKSLPYSQRASLPRQPGIYYVYAGSNPFTRRLLYIGKAENLRKRHASHEKIELFKAYGATHLEYQPCSLRRLKHEEGLAQAKHHTLLNKRQEKPDARLLWQDRLSDYVARTIAASILITVAWRYLLPMLINWLVNG